MVIVTLKNGMNFYMDGATKKNLDSQCFNVPKDWDFVNIISGNNMVRVGKSVLAMQLAAYCADRLGTPFSLDNITMTGKEFINFANKAPKNSVIVYDESAEGLRAAKNGNRVIDLLLDFFDECGQLNHIFFIVAPNFFRLKQDITIERAEYLFNVYRVPEIVKDKEGQDVINLQRGVYQFFDRKQKLLLYERYLKTRQMNYSTRCMVGCFRNIYTVDEAAYREKKKKSLQRLKEEKPVKWKEDYFRLLTMVKKVENLSANDMIKRYNIDEDERNIQEITHNQLKNDVDGYYSEFLGCRGRNITQGNPPKVKGGVLSSDLEDENDE